MRLAGGDRVAVGGGHRSPRPPAGSVRAIDIAAGNGISGEALLAEGIRPVLGTDIVDVARAGGPA